MAPVRGSPVLHRVIYSERSENIKHLVANDKASKPLPSLLKIWHWDKNGPSWGSDVYVHRFKKRKDEEEESSCQKPQAPEP